jgi:hypothetical protein
LATPKNGRVRGTFPEWGIHQCGILIFVRANNRFRIDFQYAIDSDYALSPLALNVNWDPPHAYDLAHHAAPISEEPAGLTKENCFQRFALLRRRGFMSVHRQSPVSVVEVRAGRVNGQLRDTASKVCVTVETLVNTPRDVPQAAAVTGRQPHRAWAYHLTIAGVYNFPVDAPILTIHHLLPVLEAGLLA